MAQLASSKSTVAQEPAKPRRALGLRASMALVIGNMIGAYYASERDTGKTNFF
jgi:hypothetical protein